MRTSRILAAALALGATRAAAEPQPLPRTWRTVPAHAVVHQVVALADALDLTPAQTDQLEALAQSLRRGQPVVRGLDRIPGKSVQRIEWRTPSAMEAYGRALALLTPAQQTRIGLLLNAAAR